MNDRVNQLMEAVDIVQTKHEKGEREWLEVREQFLEEKSIYIHRIQFLEEYIASMHWFSLYLPKIESTLFSLNTLNSLVH